MRGALRLLILPAVASQLSCPAAAQPGLPPDPLPPRRGTSQPVLPPIEPAPEPAQPPPPAVPPQPAEPARPSRGGTFLLRGVRLTGSTVLDQAAVEGVVAPYLHRPVGITDLETIRQDLTLLYVRAGYINSGIVIPDQSISDGAVTLQAIEGKLSAIEVSGNRYYRSSFLTDRLQRGVSTPFNVNDLARQQQILLQDPFLRRLNLNIQPGLLPGEATLVGEVSDAWPFSLTAQIANSQSPTVGEVRGQLQGVIANVLGVGDVLALQYGRSEGLNDGAISYTVPIASDDTRLSLRYDVNSTLVVASDLRPLNITSRYHSIGVGLSRPFYRTPEQSFTLGLSLEWRQSRTFLFDEPFSFAEGAVNGRTNVTALRFYQDWLDQNAQRVLALRSTFSLGIKALGATVARGEPSSQFFSWLGQAQYVRRLFGTWEALLRGSLQLSANPLFPIEQFVLGGLYTVRGYREYLTATDNAFAGTAELRIPLGRLPVPVLSNTSEAGLVQLTPFTDYGVGWNTGRRTPGEARLPSIGVGLRWLIGSGMAAELYYGHALRHIDQGNSLQSQGIHFRVTSSLF